MVPYAELLHVHVRGRGAGRYLGAQLHYKRWWTATAPYSANYFADAEPYRLRAKYCPSQPMFLRTHLELTGICHTFYL